MYRLSIDPGLDGMGWALWDHYGTEADWFRLEPPKDCGVIPKVVLTSDRNQLVWQYRALAMAKIVRSLFFRIKIHDVYIEWPHYRTDEVGQTATARGDIHKLTFLIGCISFEMFDTGARIHLVGVNEWKGQLPKKVVQRRITDLFDTLATGGVDVPLIESHAWDAVGIGLYAKGYSFNAK